MPVSPLGRDAELGRLRKLRDGGGASVLLLGEAGMGKSTVLASLAGDVTTIGVRGERAERDLPFGALHRLMTPRFGRLPPLVDGLPLRCAVHDLLTRQPVLCLV